MSMLMHFCRHDIYKNLCQFSDKHVLVPFQWRSLFGILEALWWQILLLPTTKIFKVSNYPIVYFMVIMTT